MSVLENESISVSCSNCKAIVKVPLSKILKKGVTCDKCSAKLDTARFRRSAQNLEEKLGELGSNIGKAAGE